MVRLLTFILILSVGVVNAQNITGDWTGKLAVQGTELSIVFHITYDETYAATMDSPDQGAFAIPCGEVTLIDNVVNIRIPAIGGGYEGELSGEQEMQGYWSQGGAKLPLNLHKGTGEVVIIRKPQEPMPPYPYESTDIEVENKAADVVLAGTLTMPEGDGPFPATILVSGSGPQNRDEALLGHKPFLVLADYLTRNGIAVLRYDDRGTAKSTGNFGVATSVDFASDALAALKWLQKQEKVDPLRAGIIGHSEGGLIAPMVASEYDQTGFIVLMAGPGVNGAEILDQQTRLITIANGASEDEVNKVLKLNAGAFDIVTQEPDVEKAKTSLTEYANSYYTSLSDEEKGKPENNKETLMAAFNAVNTNWFRYFLTYEPGPALQMVRCPVLAINGETDLQVPPKENLAAIEEALRKGKNANYKIEELPGLNHLFQPSETGAPSEYASNDVTFSEDAMSMITEWIKGLGH